MASIGTATVKIVPEFDTGVVVRRGDTLVVGMSDGVAADAVRDDLVAIADELGIKVVVIEECTSLAVVRSDQ